MEVTMYPLYPTMLQEHLIQRVRAISDARDEKLQSIKTTNDAMEYCAQVKQKITQCFGNLPQKTPLNTQVIREDKYDGYVRQNIIFESRPGYFVTANLYIPDGTGKVPVVLGCCGHSSDGKASYQNFSIGLVKQGYMVLIVDPVSQGERWQYESDDIPGKSWQGQSCVNEHNAIGKPQRLIKEFFGTWRLWDKIRGLDLLLAHPRADHANVGVTGNSGGGTLTSYINAIDDRITMAAPGCYITSYLHNLENSLPCDAEQMIPNMLANGMEMIDLIIATAPRPVIILAQMYDFFDHRGAQEGFSQAKKIYRLLGAETNINLFIGPEPHGFGLDNRQAMYNFFNKHSNKQLARNESQLNIQLAEDDKLLACNGNVRTISSRPTWQFTAEKAKQLKAHQPVLTKPQKLSKLTELLKLPSRNGICHYRSSMIQPLQANAPETQEKAFLTQYLIETQKDMLAVLNRIVLGDPNKCFCLDPCPELSLFLFDSPFYDQYDSQANTIMARKFTDSWVLDVRGFGMTEAKSLRDYTLDHPYGMDYMLASTYDMLGESLLGWRVHDTLCALDLLAEKGAKEITLIGKGNAAIIAALAAALHPKVKNLETINPPDTFFQMTQKPISPALFSNVTPEFLQHFDWTDFISLVQ